MPVLLVKAGKSACPGEGPPQPPGQRNKNTSRTGTPACPFAGEIVLVQPDLEESPFGLVSKLWGSFRVNSLYMILLEELRFPLFCSGVGWVVR